MSSNTQTTGQKRILTKKELLLLLFRYAKEESLNRVRDLFNNYPECKNILYDVDKQGLNVLHHVCRHNRLEIISFLIEEQGMNVDCPTQQRMTPLHYAARYPKKPNLHIDDPVKNVNDPHHKTFNPTRLFSEEIDDVIKTDKFVSKFKNLFEKNKQSEDETEDVFDDDLDLFVKQLDAKVEPDIEPDTTKVEVESESENEEEDENLLPFKYRRALNQPKHVFNKVLHYLILKGAQVNAKDIKGCTPIHYAVDKNNEGGLLELIVQKGVLINDPDIAEKTPLHRAMIQNLPNIVKILLYCGANIRSVDSELRTVLHDGCKFNSLKSVDVFLASLKPSEINEFMFWPDKRKFCPLHTAVKNKAYDVFLKLNEYCPGFLELTDQDDTLFHLAVKSGDHLMVKTLIEKNIFSSFPDAEGMLPIHTAALVNELTLSTVLDKFAIDIRNLRQETALLLVCKTGDTSAINLLLDKGANPMCVDRNFNNFMTNIAFAGNPENLNIMNKYEDLHLLVNAANINFNTPLHIAVKEDKFSFLREFLSKCSVNTAMKNERCQTALHIAAERGKLDIVDMLLKHGADVDVVDDMNETPLHKACLFGHFDCVESILQKNPNLTILNKRNFTPLTTAATNGHDIIVETLLKAGAMANPQSSSEFPSIHAATKHGHVRTIKLLLDRGADPRIRVSDKNKLNGANALDIAIQYNQIKSASVFILTKDLIPSILCNRFITKNGDYTSTLREMINSMPELVSDVFDWSITTNELSKEDSKLSVTFDFELLDDSFACWNINAPEHYEADGALIINKSVDDYQNIYDQNGKIKDSADFYDSDLKRLYENHPLNVLAQRNDSKLLRHPLVNALLIQKWKKFGFPLYYLNLILFTVFLGLFNAYMLINSPPYKLSIGTKTEEEVCQKSAQVLYSRVILFLNISITAFAGLGLLKELYQLGRKKIYYFSSWDNYFEIFTYISAILVVCEMNHCKTYTGLREPWQWQLGIIACLTCWLTFGMFLQKLPLIGHYVIMFLKVTKTFLKLLLIFLILIITYAIPCFLIFSKNPSFVTPAHSVIKVLVMTIGEVDYAGLFYDNVIEYPFSSDFIFFTFIILMNIILMNLTVGLAIDDIGEIMNQSQLNYDVLRIKLCLDTERTMTKKNIKKFVVKSKTVYPNEPKKVLDILIGQLFKLNMPDFRSARWILKSSESTETRVKSIFQDFKQVQVYMKELGEFARRISYHSEKKNKGD